MNDPSTRRRGSIMPVVALLMVCLCGFTALSVEVATIATVKVQCQNAADSAALAGARTLNGGTTSSTSQAQANALAAASGNSALGMNSAGTIAVVPFSSSEVSSTCGTYHYNTSSQTFAPAYTLASGENYNLVSATVQRVVKNNFFAVAGGANASAATPTIVANAVAAHRPRDVAVVLDFSGSMNNESDLWNCESYLANYDNQSNNSDPVVPAFGHYSSSTAALVSSSVAPNGTSNMTQSLSGMPAIVNSYYATSATTTPSVSAFTAAPNSYATAPLGDITANQYLSPTYPYVTNVNDLLGGAFGTSFISTAGSGFWLNFQLGGYDYAYALGNIYYGNPAAPSGHLNGTGSPGFSGYTVGPKYWGKTFFIWPPDPRSTCDWRQLYFTDASNNPVVNNTTLWNASSQTWNFPWSGGTTNYHINYKAILNWIKNIGPNPFPSTLIAGGITYYTAIPTDVPASAYDYSQPNSNITNADQRFWKEYIDYCLGVWTDPYGNQQPPGNPSCSYGPDYNWGTVQITAKPTGLLGTGLTLAYMNFADNPPRPRHRMWFGPMTMLQYIADTGLSPGTVRDISTYSAKLGIASVLQDIQVNHPNDLVSLILFSRPQFSGEPTIGQFNQAVYGLNRNYSAMTSSLWYPPNYGTSIRPWDVNELQTPHADLDYTSNTATEHGLMLAYNQLSSCTSLASANAGGLGRVGATKLIILETDGMANVNTSAGFTNNGANNSYYNILPGQTITAANYNETALLQVAQAICNTSTGTAGNANSVVSNPGYPGFSTTTKPVQIQTIAFGIVFQISSSTQTSAVSLLQDISQIGGTTFPSSSTDPTNGYKWCIGDLNTRTQLLQQAFANILNTGNSISLVQ